MTIFKFCLEVTDEQTISMPKGARILSVAEQRDELCLWSLVDETRPTEERTIYVVGTGNPAKHVDTAIFIGTVQISSFVWHIFERRCS